MPRVSIALGEDVHRRLKTAAASRGASVSALVGAVVDEALRMAEHPGIVFRDGPTGRRAGLVRGLDVWEVVGVLDQMDGAMADKVRATATHLALTTREVEQAVAYWRSFPEEIDERLRANDAAAEAQGDEERTTADDQGVHSPDPP